MSAPVSAPAKILALLDALPAPGARQRLCSRCESLAAHARKAGFADPPVHEVESWTQFSVRYYGAFCRECARLGMVRPLERPVRGRRRGPPPARGARSRAESPHRARIGASGPPRVSPTRSDEDDTVHVTHHVTHDRQEIAHERFIQFINPSDTQPVALTAARAELEDLLDDLGPDETRVLVSIAHRLRHGAEVYGELEVALDRRDFRKKEAREELEDALVYLACAWLKTEEGGEV